MERYTPDTAEVNLHAAGSTPLFDVRLQVVVSHGSEPHVSVVPGLPEIEHALLRTVDDTIAVVKVR